jgi:hypothetical protein
VALADRDRHGYSILQDVAARTAGKIKLSAGTLYSSIRRLLQQGLIEELKESPEPDNTDERRRYYRLTPFGRNVALAEARRLNDLLTQARSTGLIPRSCKPMFFRTLVLCHPAAFRHEYAAECRSAVARGTAQRRMSGGGDDPAAGGRRYAGDGPGRASACVAAASGIADGGLRV